MVSSFPLCMFVLTVCGAAEGPEEGAWGCMGAGGESALEGGEVQGLRHTPSLEKTRAGQKLKSFERWRSHFFTALPEGLREGAPSQDRCPELWAPCSSPPCACFRREGLGLI